MNRLQKLNWRPPVLPLRSLVGLKVSENEGLTMAAVPGGQIDTVMHETRVFPPPKEFAAKARIRSFDEYQKLWDKAAADPVKFWADLAREELHWFQPFEKPLVWKE